MNVWNMLKRERKDQRKLYGWCWICKAGGTREWLRRHFELCHPGIKVEG